jgi:hypothetical protein
VRSNQKGVGKTLAGKQSRNVRQRAENFIAGVRVALAAGSSLASWVAAPLGWGGAACSQCARADLHAALSHLSGHACICSAVSASPTSSVLAAPQSSADVVLV